MLGTSTVYTDEQTQPDNEAHHVFTVDTLYDATNFNFANNNIFWDQEVLDYYASNDTVNQVEVFSDLVLQSLGTDGSETFFSEPLTLSSVPVSLLQYVQDLYANPAAEDMFDFVVEDIILQGTSFDSGNLFDFATFDPCYSPDTQSATADAQGEAIGAVQTCAMLVSVFEPAISNTLNLGLSPNPVQQDATFSYSLSQVGAVRLTVHNAIGQELNVLVDQVQPSGDYQLNYNFVNQLSTGIYVARLQTEEGQMSIKFVVR